MIVGIDFGTCYSSAAIMSGLIPVTNYMKTDTTCMGIPSLFMYSAEEGRELYGEECATGKAYRNAGKTSAHAKKLLDSIRSFWISWARILVIQLSRPP